MSPRARSHLALLCAVVAWMPGALLGGQSLWVHDLRHHHAPWRAWAAGEWLAGRVPTWAPAVGLGFPLMAEGQAGAFYPPNLIFGLLPAGDALDGSVALHLLWAGLGALRLGRALGQDEGGARILAVAYAFGGVMATHSLYLGFFHVAAWLPWVMAAVARGSGAGVGLGAAMMLVAGHPQAAVFGLLLAGAQALATGRLGAFLRGLGAAAVAAAPQLWATARLVGDSMRQGGVSEAFADIGSLWPPELIGGLLPTFFGVDHPAAIAETYYHRGGAYWGRGEASWEVAFYLGLPAVLLAAVGARGRRWVVGLAGLAVLLMMGRYTPLWGLLRRLPGLDGFRFPVRFSLVLSLLVAILAGFGVGQLDGLRVRLRRIALGIALCLPLVFGAGSLALRLVEEPLRQRLIAQLSTPLPPPPLDLGPLQAAALPQPEAHDPAQAPARAAALITAAAASLSPIGGVCLGAAAALGACGLALGIADGRRRGAALALVLYADLWRFGADFPGTVPQAESAVVGAAVEVMAGRPGRYAVVDRRQDPALDAQLLSSNLGLAWGLRDVLIPSPLLRVRAEAVLATAGLDVGDKGVAKVARLAAHPGLVDLLGVRWLLSVHDLGPAGYAERPIDAGPVRLFENVDPLPAAFVVGCAAPAGEPFAALLAADLRGVAVLEGVHGLPVCAAAGPVGRAAVTEVGPTTREIAVVAEQPGLLVFTESAAPGWSATVDGVEAPLRVADLLFLGLELPAGAHQVRLVYRSPGLWLGPLGLGLLLGLWAWERHQGAKTMG